MPLTIRNRRDETISSLDQWEERAPPVNPEHWQDFRSAKELAQAWLREGEPAVPKELTELLNGCAETRGFLFHDAIAEKIVKLDDYPGGHRNSDMVVYGKQERRKIVVGVEAKADEPFDSRSVGAALEEVAGNHDSNLPNRIDCLSRALFGGPVEDHVRLLRYQLLHGLAAVAIEAKQARADLAVFVVHDFISLALDFDKVARNARDLEAFIKTVRGWAQAEVCAGRLLPAIRLPGCGRVPGDMPILFGKVRTLIPLDSRFGARPRPGLQERSHQYLIG